MIAAAASGWMLAGGLLALVLWLRHTLNARREAVARVGHELRGPLTAASLGFGLCQRDGGFSVARTRAIEAELERAICLVRDLAEVEGHDEQRAPTALRILEPVSMTRLLSEVVAAAEGRAVAAGAELDGAWEGPDALVWGDRVRLAQALGNLVANALEHGAGAVQVRGGTRGPWAHVKVLDGGPGLPASVAEFARRPRAGRGERGRGLAITQEIVSRHGGEIATAPSSEGAVLVLTLPVGSEPSARLA